MMMTRPDVVPGIARSCRKIVCPGTALSIVVIAAPTCVLATPKQDSWLWEPGHGLVVWSQSLNYEASAPTVFALRRRPLDRRPSPPIRVAVYGEVGPFRNVDDTRQSMDCCPGQVAGRPSPLRRVPVTCRALASRLDAGGGPQTALMGLQH